MRNKFKVGGYGQFSREFVDGYVKSWSEEDKKSLDQESLVIGYQAVEPEWEDSEDMEEADELNELEGLDELEKTPDNGEEEEAREAKRLKSDEYA